MNHPDQQPDDPQEEHSENPVKHGPEIFPRMSPVAAGFLGLFGGFFLYQIVGGTLQVIIIGTDFSEASANSIRLMTMAGQILFLLLPALILSKMVYEDVTEIIRFRLPKLTEVILFSAGILVLTVLLQYYLYIQNHFISRWAEMSPFVEAVKNFFDSLNEMVDSAYATLLHADNIFEGLLVILVIAIVPAVTEEIMFRGYIQRSMEFRLKPIMGGSDYCCFFRLISF
jgi:uncharacterized protein